MTRRAGALAIAAALVALVLPAAEAASRVRLITTGGTIANASADRLSDEDLLRTLPGGAPSGIEVQAEPFASATSTSLSIVLWKIAPASSSSNRSSRAFTRLPLCASAMCPPRERASTGCAFSRVEEPAVL